MRGSEGGAGSIRDGGAWVAAVTLTADVRVVEPLGSELHKTNLIFDPFQSARAVRSQDSMPAMWTMAEDRARSASLLMMA